MPPGGGRPCRPPGRSPMSSGIDASACRSRVSSWSWLGPATLPRKSTTLPMCWSRMFFTSRSLSSTARPRKPSMSIWPIFCSRVAGGVSSAGRRGVCNGGGGAPTAQWMGWLAPARPALIGATQPASRVAAAACVERRRNWRREASCEKSASGMVDLKAANCCAAYCTGTGQRIGEWPTGCRGRNAALE